MKRMTLNDYEEIKVESITADDDDFIFPTKERTYSNTELKGENNSE